jgi:hypothetical protein
MSQLTSVASRVAQNYSKVSGDKEAALDPATISGFIGLIQEVITLFKNCKQTPAQAVKSMKNPSLGQRVSLRRTVRQELGRKDFRAEGDKVVDALLNTGSTLLESEVDALYKETADD